MLPIEECHRTDYEEVVMPDEGIVRLCPSTPFVVDGDGHEMIAEDEVAAMTSDHAVEAAARAILWELGWSTPDEMEKGPLATPVPPSVQPGTPTSDVRHSNEWRISQRSSIMRTLAGYSMPTRVSGKTSPPPSVT